MVPTYIIRLNHLSALRNRYISQNHDLKSVDYIFLTALPPSILPIVFQPDLMKALIYTIYQY